MADNVIEWVRRSTQEIVPQRMKDIGGGITAAAVEIEGTAVVTGAVTTSATLPTGAPIVGQKKIGVTGTAVQLNSNSVALPGGMVIVAAHPDNAAKMTVGAAAVTNTVDGTGNGAILAPGEAIAVFVANVNLVYINGTANDIASYSAG